MRSFRITDPLPELFDFFEANGIPVEPGPPMGSFDDMPEDGHLRIRSVTNYGSGNFDFGLVHTTWLVALSAVATSADAAQELLQKAWDKLAEKHFDVPGVGGVRLGSPVRRVQLHHTGYHAFELTLAVRM